jgi:hypothetical protein
VAPSHSCFPGNAFADSEIFAARFKVARICVGQNKSTVFDEQIGLSANNYSDHGGQQAAQLLHAGRIFAHAARSSRLRLIRRTSWRIAADMRFEELIPLETWRTAWGLTPSFLARRL